MFGNYTEAKEYNDFFKEEIKMQLEARYNHFCMFGNYRDAYETLGILMGYNILDKDDSRLNSSGTLLKELNKLDPSYYSSHRFLYDIRNRNDQLGEWVYYKGLPFLGKYTVKSSPYWGKRIEGNYSANMVYKSREHVINMSLNRTPKQAKNSIEFIDKTFKNEFGVAGMTEEDYRLAVEGLIRIYTLEFDTSINHSCKTLGHVVLFQDGQITKAVLVLRNDVLKRYFINIMNAYNNTTNALKEFGLTNVSYMSFCNLKRHIVEQEQLIEEQYKLNDILADKGERSVEIVR